MFDAAIATISRRDQALAALRSAVDQVRDASRGDDASTDALGDLLRAADVLTACAVGIIGRGGFTSGSGLPAEMSLKLHGRRTGPDARMLAEVASLGSSMPIMLELFTRGLLSFAQVRSIALAVRCLGIGAKGEVDALIASSLDRCSDPDDLVTRVDAAVARLRPDLALAREDRSIERSFLAVQGRLNGSASIYGEADAASAATIIGAIDAASARPVGAGDPDDADASSRSAQRFEGLLAICERFLGRSGAGDDTTTRPRPRLIASVDLATIATDGARVLWAAAGRAPSISPLSAEVLLCDAEIVPVVFDGARPVGVGNASRSIPDKLRTALIARDGRCRFPGCRAPVAWTDAHHIIPVSQRGPTTEGNCLLLCRRCHRRVHRFAWTITVAPDGVIDFRHRGRTFSSRPAAQLRA